MSQEFSQYDQPRNEYEAPVRKKSGCSKGCLIVLIILGVIMAVLIGVVFWVVRHVSQGMSQDPIEIAKRLKEQYPTAELPGGYEGKFAIKSTIILDINMLIFARENADIDEEGEIITGDFMILFSVKMDGMQPEELEEAMESTNKGGKVVEKKPYPIKTGEYEFEGSMQKVQKRRNGELQKFTQLVVPLGNSTLLIMQGDNDKVDEEALKKFLLSIAKDCPTAKKAEEKKD
jgi:hypothetical protein